MSTHPEVDADRAAVRRASWRVGIHLAVTTSVVVLVVLAAVVGFVLRHLHSSDTGDPPGVIDVDSKDLLTAALLIGLCAIGLATVVSWYATRRAVEPLAKALRLQRRFVADASHELRTPITILDTRLQLMQRRQAAEDPMRPTVDQLRRETANLSAIVTDLLSATTVVDAKAPDTTCDAMAVLRGVVASMDVLGDDRDVHLRLDGPGRAEAAIPAVALHRAVVALLDNALKHAPRGSRIDIDVAVGHDKVSIDVRDAGGGVIGIEPERIFERFARGSTENARAGQGIGLSLVRDTAQRFGGSILLVDHDGPGAQFRLTLPAARGPRVGSTPAAFSPAPANGTTATVTPGHRPSHRS